MCQGILTIHQNVFEKIKHISDNGEEYWLASEIKALLECSDRTFEAAAEKAKTACRLSINDVDLNFIRIRKVLALPEGGVKKLDDYRLTSYACYLIMRNSDPNKATEAGLPYFAAKVRPLWD